MLPTRELPTALRLPLYERGLSPLDLGLARLLRFDLGERTLFFAEGLRGMMHGVAARFTSPSPGGAEKTQQFVDAWMLAALADYVTPITPEEPVVRMMAATVRMATARGVPVVVIGSPVPWTALATHGWWDAQAFADRFTTLGAVVTESGGRFLDLHTALGPDGFSDTAGHFTPAGVERIAELVTPVVRDLLRQHAVPVAQAPESVFGMVTAGSQPRRRVPRPRSAS